MIEREFDFRLLFTTTQATEVIKCFQIKPLLSSERRNGLLLTGTIIVLFGTNHVRMRLIVLLTGRTTTSATMAVTSVASPLIGAKGTMTLFLVAFATDFSLTGTSINQVFESVG